MVRANHQSLAPDLGELCGELGQRRIKIGDQAVIGDLEDRRFLVLVDGDDDLGVLHAGQMLDRPRNADGNIELGATTLPVWPWKTG